MRINLSGRIISRDKENKANNHTPKSINYRQTTMIAPSYVNYGR